MWLLHVRMWPLGETRMPVPYDGKPLNPPAPKSLTILRLTSAAVVVNDCWADSAAALPRRSKTPRVLYGFMIPSPPAGLRRAARQASFLHRERREVKRPIMAFAVLNLQAMRQHAA